LPSSKPLHIDERMLRDYRTAAAIIRSVLEDRDSRTGLGLEWPESSDPSLEEALSLLLKYSEPDVFPAPLEKARQRQRLDDVASSFEQGRPIVDGLVHRLWRVGLFISDHGKGLVFIFGAVAVIYGIVYAITYGVP